MTAKRKICVVTGSRAEYGLLYWLMKGIQASKKLELQIVVTGMHLSPEFGLTYKHMEHDGFTINNKVEMLLSSDSEVGITKSMGLGLICFADVLDESNPDFMVILGDRFEVFAAATAAMIAKVPVVHLHGGEITEGVFDESIRHSISKMSHLHFTATEEYRKRVIQLGEQPDRVFNVGSIGVDNISRLNLLSKKEFEKSIQFKLGEKNLLVTFHPVTLEDKTSEVQFGNLLVSVEKLDKTHIIFTKANADTDGRVINEMIDKYVANHTKSSVAFDSLGQLRYLSAMRHIDGVVGNSSSGILEVPSFKIGTVNIGDRQKGRTRASSVIDCLPTEDDISRAIIKLFSTEFKQLVKQTTSPFGEGGATEKIIEVLESTSIDGILKKQFYDVK